MHECLSGFRTSYLIDTCTVCKLVVVGTKYSLHWMILLSLFAAS